MRIVLVGAVESTEVAFETLIAAAALPSAIVTLPPEALVRHSDAVDLVPLAQQHGIPVIFAADVNSPATLEVLIGLEPDLVLVIGWSQICKAAFRATARIGCIGFHPSALPQLRGRAVIPWTILIGQASTGSTFFWLDDGIDTGDIIVQRQFSLDEDETARSLYEKHMDSIRETLPQVIDQFAAGNPARIPQNEEKASYCARRGPEDGRIDWSASACQILSLIRAAGDPYPGAFTTIGPDRLVINRARSLVGGERYIGMPGQVQTRTESGFAVKCGDGACIEILEWSRGGDKMPARHSVLGR